ncbi:MAG: hypothetical protein JJU34_09850 [Lunatimonas sp.]|uniref:hypothetical protein n=1 Tax=Lunatimonas sp. TaxID=2060141 RepID=UPI00263A5C86|nr:hypothetical protein [Lunatimonas sp.]MCC5937575.1 hypothetical protein [Lunatimonas sp.]
MEKQQNCPICKQEVAYYSRYPKYLCKACSDLTTDAEGRPVAFYNTTVFGQGCQGEYRDTGEPYEGDICYVQGVTCKAEEHRFGGIVVQAV